MSNQYNVQPHLMTLIRDADSHRRRSLGVIIHQLDQNIHAKARAETDTQRESLDAEWRVLLTELDDYNAIYNHAFLPIKIKPLIANWPPVPINATLNRINTALLGPGRRTNLLSCNLTTDTNAKGLWPRRFHKEAHLKKLIGYVQEQANRKPRFLFPNGTTPRTGSLKLDPALDEAAKIHLHLASGTFKLDEFLLFVELPVELRLKIWGCSAYQTTRLITFYPRMVSLVPSLLHVNRESREIALNVWTLYPGIPYSPRYQGRAIFLNMDLDTFVLLHDRVWGARPLYDTFQILNRTKHVAITSDVHEHLEQIMGYLTRTDHDGAIPTYPAWTDMCALWAIWNGMRGNIQVTERSRAARPLNFETMTMVFNKQREISSPHMRLYEEDRELGNINVVKKTFWEGRIGAIREMLRLLGKESTVNVPIHGEVRFAVAK